VEKSQLTSDYPSSQAAATANRAKLMVTRKLAAILAADVAGFTRLASADEERTLDRLRALRGDLIDPTIAAHNGRVVKRTGDGLLAEFRSVVDAVRCALDFQNGMVERNSGLPPETRIEFRIGVHLGDVVEETDGDLMGDGVNIAARLEGIAKPGSIYLSEDAYRQVRARLDLAISDLGQNRLKNIPEPVRVYAVEVASSSKGNLSRSPRRRHLVSAGLLATVAFFLVAGVAWRLIGPRQISTSASNTAPMAGAPAISAAAVSELVKLADAEFESKNYAAALDRYRSAAEQGNAHAQARLGAMYRNGNGVDRDYAEAMRWYRKAADQGDALGEAGLGNLFEYGQGVDRNYSEAFKWFEKAAVQGLTYAQNQIGAFYENGLGVPKDASVAMKWYRKAADAGDGWAQTSIGDLYWGRAGIEQDYAEAMRWYRKAAEQSNLGGQTGIGALYERGLGVAIDYGQALSWYRKAAEQEYWAAEEDLGRLYENGLGVVRDYSEAMKWYRKAANGGSASAKMAVGNLYRDGLGVAKDEKEASRWYREAAETGYDWAQVSLGYLYATGGGVAKDCAAAREWFEKAAASGNDVARTWLNSNSDCGSAAKR
jgi:TPR repeat protein/class 3 adenylate cyclase